MRRAEANRAPQHAPGHSERANAPGDLSIGTSDTELSKEGGRSGVPGASPGNEAAGLPAFKIATGTVRRVHSDRSAEWTYSQTPMQVRRTFALIRPGAQHNIGC
jgi:hypothetical protein